ncbi:MAG: hypothetical protein MKZ80_00520 [Candidatus Nitrosopelagicus sp.]|nr:hypothetical protein [Candidatus Nitrosopelagicus sp.]
MRLYYSQKTDNVLHKFELLEWRNRVNESLDEKHQDLSDNWLSCALGERMKLEGRFLKNIKDLSPEAIKLGYDFSIAMQERDNVSALRIINEIESLPTIWRNES